MVGVPWMPEFSGSPQPEVNHSLGKQEATLRLQGTTAGGQAYRCAEGVGILVKVRGWEWSVSMSKDARESAKVHTVGGWCCQVAEGGYVLGMWLRHTPRDVLTLMLVTECAATGSSRRGSSLCRIPLALSGQKGWRGVHIMGNCWRSSVRCCREGTERWSWSLEAINELITDTVIFSK